jgi:hypothetical protein
MAEMCVRVRPQMGSEGVYRVRVSEGYGESQMCCRDWAATREQGPNSINGHPRGHEHEPRTEEEGLQGGCSLLLAVVSSLSCCRVVSALPSVFTESHTHAHAHREDAGRKTNAASDACEEHRQHKAPDMQVASSAVHERDGSPQRRSNHGDSSFSNYSNGPVGAARLSPGSLLDAFLWGSTTGTAQANGDGPLV